jgi:RNA polymerase sigma-70 factor, ECF subfamily
MESIGYIKDCSLIRQAQGGNQAAFEQLVRAYDQAVLRLALRLTGSQRDAQDIHQEAFIRVYKKLDGFRFECSFSTWIYRIATNLCLDHLRRNRTRRRNNAIEVNDEDLLNQLSDDRPANNPEQQLLDQELGAHISRALQRLTPRERVVFDLRHFQGLNLQSVSQILNTSEGSVKMTFFRATRKLRCQLERYTKRNRSLMKQHSDNGSNQPQKAKRLVVSANLAGTLPTPGSELRPSTTERILIIEDDPALQETLRQLFSTEGYAVDFVTNGVAGLQMLRHRRPSAMIVDIQHPGPSQRDLCQKIANLMPGLPLVVLSASLEVADTVLPLEAGADDFVTIPFSSRELVARIRMLIRRASRLALESLYLDEARCL